MRNLFRRARLPVQEPPPERPWTYRLLKYEDGISHYEILFPIGAATMPLSQSTLLVTHPTLGARAFRVLDHPPVVAGGGMTIQWEMHIDLPPYEAEREIERFELTVVSAR